MTLRDEVCRSYSRGKVKNVLYNDRCGYAIVFYDPIFDLDTKIAPLKMADLPYTIPLDRKQLSKLKPAGRPMNADEVRRVVKPGECEAAKDFIQRKIIERKMDEIRDACYNITKCYEKAEKFDLKRREVISPRMKLKFRGKTSDEICDVLVDDVMQNVDYVYEKQIEEKGKTQKKLALAALRRAARAPKPVTKIHLIEPKLVVVKEEEKEIEEKPAIKKEQSITKELLTTELSKSEKKFEQLPLEKDFYPTPPRGGLESYNKFKRHHDEVMSQRAADALLFETMYGRQLRRLKREIRRLREDYS
ncbi:hypothetical protein PVAND_008409 [Polypedilum vanderplanki]|uniref:Uncharacterized protein n=1 Tax=Polypedilum vanderplanki TaxID=319348 RepID=A0A9J6CA42_POLVA|nr:hypothetical protein PVAND_008409 [Polypedilum vanderplanki]